MRTRRPWLILGAIALLAVASAFAGRSWWISRHQFDSARWKAERSHRDCGGTSDGNARRRMVENLQEEHLSTGMSQRAVLRLLGPPDRTYERSDHPTRGPQWTWLTGEMAFLDCSTLYVRFANGRAVQVGVGQD
jgi:hypothetical protein